jgi:myo-inositol catabolism protein IolC
MSSTPTDRWFLFAFDHRDSFRKMAGSANDDNLIAAKRLLFNGFATAHSQAADTEGMAILVDEQYGSVFVAEARELGARVVMPVERSGLPELELEYGAAFGEHINGFNPDAIKVLLRWDPDGDVNVNLRQGRRLCELSQWMSDQGRSLIVEFLTPVVEPSSARAAIMVRAIDQIRDSGVEPAWWKIEGLDDTASNADVAARIEANGRGERAVVLGRGASMDRVVGWLDAARALPTFGGFAVGKTLWQDPMQAHLRGKVSREAAITEIARRYLQLVNTWQAP